MQEKGKLYIIPSELASDAPYSKVFTNHHQETIKHLRSYFVENVRTARRFISNFPLETSISEMLFFDIGKKKIVEEYEQGLQLLLTESMGLLSEAGCPSIADPGQEVVMFAHNKGLEVIPLVGPSSITLALMSSGLNGQSFTFLGYLPIDKLKRQKKIKQLENQSRKFFQTQIFIETPYRNNQLLEALLETCHPNTYLCIASNLTSVEYQWIQTKKIKDWNKKLPDLNKKPTIFLFQA